MKTLKLGIPLVFIFLSSCYFWQSNWYDSYSIQNETNHKIIILSYKHIKFNGDSIIEEGDSIELDAGEIFKQIYKKGEGGGGSGLFSIYPEDSAIMIFDDLKVQHYYVCDPRYSPCIEVKNPLRPYNFFDKVCPRDVGCDYTYTITEEDYEMAEFINKE